jgi:glycosyltransferase involved in cell wall biosynthesis
MADEHLEEVGFVNTPVVSIIVGTYNCHSFLDGLFESIRAQTWTDYEVVVVDDASDDGLTLQQLESAGDSIRLIRREVNSGTCERPRYQGVKAARAPYCAFLDADDRWDPEFLERAMTTLKSQPEAAMVHSYVRVIDGEGRVQRIRHEGNMPTGDDLAAALLRHCYITISAVVVKRQVWLDAVAEEALTDFGMDIDFFISIAKQYPVVFIPEVLASYRRSDASVSVKKWKRAPRNIHSLERIYRQFTWHGILAESEMRAILHDAFLEDIVYWRGQGETAKAAWFFKEGMKRFPISAALWKEGVKVIGAGICSER